MTCQEAIDVMGEAVEDRLAMDLRAGFDEHMSDCRPCATYFRQLRLTRDALRGLPHEDAPKDARDALLRSFRRHVRRSGDDA